MSLRCTPSPEESRCHRSEAVARWVEQGVAPERITATRLTNGAVVRQRPLCVYPKQARYNGSGEVNAAASFGCVDPEQGQPDFNQADIVQIQNSLRQRNVLEPTR